MKVIWELDEKDIKDALMEHYKSFGAKIKKVDILLSKETEGYGMAEHEVLHVKAIITEDRK